MAPILIFKLSLSGLLTLLETVESVIPNGKLKDVLGQIDKYGRQALDILSKVSLADDESAEQVKAKLAKNPAVVGEG